MGSGEELTMTSRRENLSQIGGGIEVNWGRMIIVTGAGTNQLERKGGKMNMNAHHPLGDLQVMIFSERKNLIEVGVSIPRVLRGGRVVDKREI